VASNACIETILAFGPSWAGEARGDSPQLAPRRTRHTVLVMTRAQQLLARLDRLLSSAERCPVCVGPSSAFDGKHLREWERLKRELRHELANLPN
jgi:hypothetical protein